MIAEKPSCIAVVAEDPLQQHRLRSAIEDFGCEVHSFSPGTLALKGLNSQQVCAWLVDLQDENELLELFLESDEPVLLGFEAAPSKQSSSYPRWEKKLYVKLKSLLGRDLIQIKGSAESLGELSDSNSVDALPLPGNLTAKKGGRAKYVWVLGSSLGGPEAVKEFLDVLPEGLPVGFIYGQHIDPQFVPVLANVLGRHSNFNLKVAVENSEVTNGEVLIVPADKEIEFIDGQVKTRNNPWPDPYGPSVDQLMLNVNRCFPHAGCILFSGMGNDGAESAQHLHEKEVLIWAQSSASCASSAMPDAARETGAVTYSGSPQELARKLVDQIQLLENSNNTGHADANSTAPNH